MFASQDQGTRRAGARGLTRSNHGGLARGLRRAAAGAVCAAAVALPLAGAASAQAATPAPHALTTTWTSLALVNGWVGYGYGTAAPAVTNINGIVHLKGEIATAGTSQVPFTLPAGDRPATEVVVPVDLGSATAGQLQIFPSGVVTVYAEQGWGNAQTLTSLDGVSFATSGSSFTPLTLQNGWANYGQGTAGAAARSISGVVHLRGVIWTSGTTGQAFTLPAALRPARGVHIQVTLCGSHYADLFINPNGVASVGPEAGAWSAAQCGTSLDGAWFANSATNYTPLTLQNGWTSNEPWGSFAPAVRKISGIIHLEGAVYNNTSPPNPQVFTLPAGFRPAHDVYVPVDLEPGTIKGHLLITPSGQVYVYAEAGQSNPGSLSLDGVSFAP
jgi:hypothetical protein